jgi:hypothetical protein
VREDESAIFDFKFVSLRHDSECYILMVTKRRTNDGIVVIRVVGSSMLNEISVLKGQA